MVNVTPAVKNLDYPLYKIFGDIPVGSSLPAVGRGFHPSFSEVLRPCILFNLKSMSLSHILVLRSSRKEFLLLGESSEVVRSSKGLFSGRKLR